MTVLNFEGFEGIGVTTGTGDAANIQDRLLKRYTGDYDNGVDGCYLEAGADGVGYSLAMNHANNWIGLPMPTNQAGKTLVVGMRFRSPASSAAGILMKIQTWSLIQSVNTPQIEIGYTAAGEIYILSGVTPIDTSIESVTYGNTWHHLEAKIFFDNTTGTYDIKLNGSTILSGGPVDTLGSNDANVDYVAFSNTFELIDDLYVLNTDGSINNDFLGVDTRIKLLLPNADGTHTDWTPSTGVDHYAVVDENPETLSDYVSSGTLNEIDTFDFPNLSVTSVYAVKAGANMMNASGGVRDVRFKAISGVTTDDAPTIGVSYDDAMEQVIENIWEADPNTAAAWTVANFNLAEFGLEVMS
jgi:hypothetical protein